MKTIKVLGFIEREHADDGAGCAVDIVCDTIAEAKDRARYYLTDEYHRIIEATQRIKYVQVRVDGEVRYDYFAKNLTTK